MSFQKIDHIAIAVADLDASVRLYENLLGKSPDHLEEVQDQKVKAAFFSIGDVNLELLYPTSEESPISNFLKTRKGGLHHICIQVSNIESQLQKLKEQGVQLIDEKPRIGAHNKKIAFVHPKSTGGVLIELSESMSK